MGVTTEYLIALDDQASTDPSLVGAKAASLARLAAAGFPVPDAVVLTTDAFAVADSADDLPDAVERAVIAAAARFDSTALAVRSSSVSEDLADRSFAGQYESVVGVRGAEDLVRAVRTVWRSAASERVTSYRDGEGAPMAVLIQRLVTADAAGVAFTADPVTGDRSTTIVEAVRGLGERAASGEQTPERWTIGDSGKATRTGGVRGVLDAGQAREVARVAREAASHGGTPQDIEWALQDGRVWLLQARPITTLDERPVAPVPIPVEVPDGYWEREATHAPVPHSPFNRLFFPMRNRATRLIFAEIGAMPEQVEFTEVGGWEYFRVVPPGGNDRKPPPAWLLGMLTRVAPPLRARSRCAADMMRRCRSGEMARSWYRRWRPELSREIERIRDLDLTRLTDRDLDLHLGELLRFGERSVEIHFRLHGAGVITIYELALACRDMLGWCDDEVWSLLAGLSTTSTEPARALAKLAEQAAGNPELHAAIEQQGPACLEGVKQADPAFASAFDEYRRTYGCRALRYEVADPTLGEQPELLLALLRDQLSLGFDPAEAAGNTDRVRSDAEAQVAQAMAAVDPVERARFDAALDLARRIYPIREDSEWYTVSAPLALIRFAALEIGDRLARRGQIEQPDDVFSLEVAEARLALTNGRDERERILRRKGERAWADTHPGPASYGTPPPPPPSLTFVPQALRIVNEGLLWYLDQNFAAERSTRRQIPDGGRIEGIAASPGRCTGTVRVIHGEDEFGKLRAGDVAVCPVTSPVWSVLFPSMGALVTDTGGMLSHPAIIAREYHLPAVVATGNATELLHDGQRVSVDGTRGVVEPA